MFSKSIKYKNFLLKSKKFKKNIKKVNEIFNNLKTDINHFNPSFLESYEKGYNFNFSNAKLKRFSKYKNIIILGMGGSILGAKSIYSFFRKRIKKKLFFFDNLDENFHEQLKKNKYLKNSLFVIVSKSGETIETIINLNIILSKNSLKNKLVFITEVVDNSLIDLAKKYGAEVIQHKSFIGGRYSVLSEAGMFPAALMGLKIDRFKNLNKLIKNKSFVFNLINNTASIYTLYNDRVRNSITLSYDSSLNDLAYWQQQLVAESLGKEGKGITPILSSAPKDHHSLLQLYLDGPKDKFFTFFNTSSRINKYKISKKIMPKKMKYLGGKNLSSIVNAQSRALQNIFKLKKIPFREIYFSKSNEQELGEIFTYFVLETIILARLMNINPYDQPAVEQV
jgi:glucose-6-phosphate isomerase